MKTSFGLSLLLLAVAGDDQIALAQSPGTFTATGSMTEVRSFHTATLLTDGRVLLAGGSGARGGLASAEVYDPSTGAFTATGGMSTPRSTHSSTLLPDGRLSRRARNRRKHDSKSKHFDPGGFVHCRPT
jgi:Galactose oxidase, central domain